MSLKEFILAERTRRDLSQEALADLLGKQKMWVSRRENGKNKITLRDIALICGALSIEIPWDIVKKEADLEEDSELFIDVKKYSGHPANEAERAWNKRKFEFSSIGYLAVPILRRGEDISAFLDSAFLEYQGNESSAPTDGWKIFSECSLCELVKSEKKAFIIKIGKASSVISLSENDEVLVDGAINLVGDAGIYLIRVANGNEFIVRKCWRTLKDGGITVGSDDPSYPSETGLSNEDLQVIGKAVWVGRRM